MSLALFSPAQSMANSASLSRLRGSISVLLSVFVPLWTVGSGAAPAPAVIKRPDRTDDLFNRIASSHTLPDGRLIDTSDGRKLAVSVANTIPNEGLVLPAIVCLLFWRGPSQISRLIAALIIDTIQRLAKRPRPNSIGEILKANDPRWVDRDPSTAIILERAIFRVKASIFHACPSVPERMKWHFNLQCFGDVIFMSTKTTRRAMT